MELSARDARRLALAAQGFGRRPAKPTLDDVRKVANKVLAVHIDSINVLVRAHYIVPFSRLGPYARESLDKLAYSRRELFEGWAHSTALMPVELFPLLRYRMRWREAAGAWSPKGERIDPRYVERVYEEVEANGPLTVAELPHAGAGEGKWWGWSAGKTALEHLWLCGRVAIAAREDFTRVYDVAERVLPEQALAAPSPGADDAQKELLRRAAGALGVATARHLAGYFGHTQTWAMPRDPSGRRPQRPWARLLRELVDDGSLEAATVEGWPEPAYVRSGVKRLRSVDVRALVSPFDELLGGADIRFGFDQRLAQQLYVPAERREYGYYVLPFVLGDEIVGRCDLKADRQAGALRVIGAFAEPAHDPHHVATELLPELRSMARWLQLDEIRVGERGDVARHLRRLAR